MASVEERLEKLESIFKLVLEGIQEARGAISKGFEIVDQNFEEVHTKLDALSDDTSSEFKDVKLHLVSLKEEITKINQVTNYEEEINNLKIVTGGKAS